MRVETLTSPLALLACLFIAMTSHGQDADRDAFRKLHNQFRERMDVDLKTAADYLDTEIAKQPDSADLNVLRHSLATQMIKADQFDDAELQFRSLLDFQIKHVDEPENQFGIWMTIQSMQELSEESSRPKGLREAVELGFAALSKLDSDSDGIPLIPVSQLAVLKAHGLVGDDKTDDAKRLINEQKEMLVAANAKDNATEDSCLAFVRFLSALSTGDPGNDPWRDDAIKNLDIASKNAMEQFPKSFALQSEFAETQYKMITLWAQDDPKANKERIESVTKKLDLLAIKNRGIRATLRRIQLHEERIAAAKPVETLVGKPAPQWEIDAWVNAVDLDRKSFEGKVVLIDFWAMWCGPCIATFDHLREWREEFGEDGFEIVGVTKYYNFEWDEENKRAKRAGEEVGNDVERECLQKFLEHHKLKHPVIVSPKDSEMSGNYGVRGIPHVVLMDREGNVQLVKTGSGEATAKAIHAKIKELVKAK